MKREIIYIYEKRNHMYMKRENHIYMKRDMSKEAYIYIKRGIQK